SMATRGIGITLMPETMCADALRKRELEVVLPEWRLPEGICHAVFASRRGLLPAVRVFIDYLAERMPPLLEAGRVRTAARHGEVAERFKAAVLITAVVATRSWVRIPPSPPSPPR